MRNVLGSKLNRCVEIEIYKINDLLKKNNINAKLLYPYEEKSKFCKISSVIKEGNTPFKIILGELLNIKIKDMEWKGNDRVFIVFE